MAEQVRRKMTKKERIAYLLNCLNKWVESGLSTEDAVAKLTVKQYDFLMDCDINLDDMVLSPKQMKVAQEVRKVPRPNFPDGYNKKYPQSKQEIFNQLVSFLKTQADEVSLPDKINYRDVDFVINDVKYHIVMSMPREKKKEGLQ